MNGQPGNQVQRYHPQRQPLPVLRSIHNRLSAFVRFINKTRSNVRIIWIDYNGKEVEYIVLGCQDYIDINTFVTHPWIFVSEETKDRFLGDRKLVYFPVSWREGREEEINQLQAAELPVRIERKIIHITSPIYTLRDLCLRVIKRRLLYDEHAQLLEIPKSLRDELANMEPRKPAPKRSST